MPTFTRLVCDVPLAANEPASDSPSDGTRSVVPPCMVSAPVHVWAPEATSRVAVSFTVMLLKLPPDAAEFLRQSFPQPRTSADTAESAAMPKRPLTVTVRPVPGLFQSDVSK